MLFDLYECMIYNVSILDTSVLIIQIKHKHF